MHDGPPNVFLFLVFWKIHKYVWQQLSVNKLHKLLKTPFSLDFNVSQMIPLVYADHNVSQLIPF